MVGKRDTFKSQKSNRSVMSVKRQDRKNRLLWALLICYCTSQTSYLNVVTLVPIYIEDNYAPRLNSTATGILLASYQASFCLSAPFVGAFLNKIGRRKAIMLGISVMSAATVFFAVAEFFKDMWVFYSISFVGRMVQGIADSLICVAIPSLVAIEFPNNNEQYQGYLEMAMGIGMTLGPVLSSLVYGSIGYSNTFFFYAAFISIFGIGSACFIPSNID
jgi:MFS family permease